MVRLSGYSKDVDDEASIAVTLQEPLIDVAFLSGVTVPTVAVIGKTIAIAATLTNRGNSPAAPSVSLYVDAATQPVDKVTTPPIQPGSTEIISLAWNTADFDHGAGERLLRLVAELPNDADISDNTAQSSINLYPSAFDHPKAPDGCINDIAVSVAGIREIDNQLREPPYYLPNETLYIDYRIYNYACDTDITVDLDLRTAENEVAIEDNKDPCLSGCLIPAGGMVEAVAAWPLSAVPPIDQEAVVATIRVLSPEDFDDTNAENDTATSPEGVNVAPLRDITLSIGTAEANKGRAVGEPARPEFGVVDLSLLAAAVEPTTLPHSVATMSLTVEAANNGLQTEPAAVEASRASSNGSEPELLYAHTIMIPPGGITKKATLEMPTYGLRIGTQTVQVGLSAVNNIAPSNPKFDFDVTRLAPPVPPVLNDVEIISIHSSPPGDAMQGQWVEISVTVRNNGDKNLNVPVQLTFPSDDKKPERKSPRVRPGETGVATFTWKTRNYDVGSHTLRAELLLDNNLTAGETSAELQILLTAPAINANILTISTDPEAPVVGQPVAITVTVRNDGPIATSIPITLHFPSPTKQPETRRPLIKPGETGVASFTWRTSNYEPGLHTFTVEVGSVSIDFVIELLPANADFTVSELSVPDQMVPIVKGDWVEISAMVHNLGPHAGSSEVSLQDTAFQEPMYRERVSLEPGDSSAVDFTWKTLRYPPGDYQVRAITKSEYDANPDNDASDIAPVAVLTDRDDHRRVRQHQPTAPNFRYDDPA